ncbi:MAG: hypothetical protein SVR94_15295 [Pseudomonadota bacterium]|nr:hypothetical protein [Pseudomonadota bacterium]
MKKLLAVALGALGVGTSVSAETELATFYAKGNAFSIQAPIAWKKNEKAQFLSVASPDGGVAITASAYGKTGGSLREFADYRYSSVESFYKSIGSEHPLRHGMYREYEGVWPGESKPTYYVVSVSEVGGAYFSITVVTDRKRFESNRDDYVKIMESAKVGS